MMLKMANNILEIFVFREAANYWSTYRARQYSKKTKAAYCKMYLSYILSLNELRIEKIKGYLVFE